MALGINHIDTADYYGPGVVNELIRDALHPYPADLAIVSKVGWVRDDAGGIHPSNDPAALYTAIEQNVRTLRIDQLAAVEPAPRRRVGALPMPVSTLSWRRWWRPATPGSSPASV